MQYVVYGFLNIIKEDMMILLQGLIGICIDNVGELLCSNFGKDVVYEVWPAISLFELHYF